MTAQVITAELLRDAQNTGRAELPFRPHKVPVAVNRFQTFRGASFFRVKPALALTKNYTGMFLN